MKIKKYSATDVIRNLKYRATEKVWVNCEDVDEFMNSLVIKPKVAGDQLEFVASTETDDSAKAWYERKGMQRLIWDFNFLAGVGLITFWGVVTDIIALP